MTRITTAQQLQHSYSILVSSNLVKNNSNAICTCEMIFQLNSITGFPLK